MYREFVWLKYLSACPADCFIGLPRLIRWSAPLTPREPCLAIVGACSFKTEGNLIWPMRDNDFIKKSGYLPDAGALTQELMTKAALVNWYINYLK